MAPHTLADGSGAVKEPLSAAEAVAEVLCMGNRKPNFLKTIGVITSRTRATKPQLELQLDSERKGRQELQSVVDELKQAKEQADAERIQCQQELHRMMNEQEDMKKRQLSYITIVEQTLAKGPSRGGAEYVALGMSS